MSASARILMAAAACMTLAGCYPSELGPKWPITQQQQSFDELDAALAEAAPPVADAVTGERIARARSEPHNWLTYYGTYDGHRFSSLNQINKANVANLRPEWQFQVAPLGLLAAPATYSFEAAPIVVLGRLCLGVRRGQR
jgi:alcohol dehydrogenase (cytochrome c)